MPTADIARAVGFHEATVRIVQRDFIGRGIDALLPHQRGGRCHQLMPPDEEAAFLKGFLKAAGDASLLTVGRIRPELEERLGREVSLSTVYRMLERNGWRKVVPRPQHPWQSKEAMEAFKKGLRGSGREGLGGGRKEEKAAERHVPGRGQVRPDHHP